MSVLLSVTLRCDNMIRVGRVGDQGPTLPCGRMYLYNSSDIDEARRGARAEHGWSAHVAKDLWTGQPIITDTCGDCNARDRKDGIPGRS